MRGELVKFLQTLKALKPAAQICKICEICAVCGAFMLFVHLDLGGTKAARQSHIWGWNEDERVGDCCGTTETELGDESDEHASIDEPPLFPIGPM